MAYRIQFISSILTVCHSITRDVDIDALSTQTSELRVWAIGWDSQAEDLDNIKIQNYQNHNQLHDYALHWTLSRPKIQIMCYQL